MDSRLRGNDVLRALDTCRKFMDCRLRGNDVCELWTLVENLWVPACAGMTTEVLFISLWQE